MQTHPPVEHPGFHRTTTGLQCDGVSLADLAKTFGTPLHVVSASVLEARVRAVREAFGPDALVCYAVKANGNLSLLRRFARLGVGFDLVSLGELRRVEAAGLTPASCVFAGVAKQRDEVVAAHRAGIRLFNLESMREIDLIAKVGRDSGRPARVAVRLNPDVDASTHAYISTAKAENKFGLDLETAARAVDRIRASDGIELCGYHVHLGSQLRTVDPYVAALDAVEAFVDADPAVRGGPSVETYDLGGGFGIPYGDGAPPLDVADVAAALRPRLEARGWRPILEPGRFLIAEAGVMLTRVVGRKCGLAKTFVMTDAGMNDLLRPALYQAVHPIEPVSTFDPRDPAGPVDVVGPICESGDFLGKDVVLPETLDEGGLLAVRDTGAYGAVMSSNYNARPRAAEVLVEADGSVVPIRRRERLQDLWAHELDAANGDPGHHHG